MWTTNDLQWLNYYVYNVDTEQIVDKSLKDIPIKNYSLKMENGTNVYVV